MSEDLFKDAATASAAGESNPPPATETPAAPATPEGASPAVTEPTAPATPVADPYDGWTPAAVQKQIARAYRNQQDAERRAADLQAEVERLRQLAETQAGRPPSAEPAQHTTVSPPAPVRTAVPPPASAGAPVMNAVEQAEFNVELKYLDARIKEDPDWDAARRNLEMAGGVSPELMRRVLDTDDAAYVLVQLGKNPVKYQEILDLPPARQQTALIKLAMEKTAPSPPPPRPSAAPAPVEHVRPAADGAHVSPNDIDLYDPKYNGSEYDAAWYAKRDQQKRESKGRRWSYKDGAAR